MNIHILTAHFYPQLHPRAFRSSELAAELVKRGHRVTVTNLTTVEDFDYMSFTEKTGVDVRNLGLYHLKTDNLENVQNTWLYHTYRFLVEYLFAGNLFRHSSIIAKRINIDHDTDAVIALSKPFMNVLAISRYVKRHGKKFVTIVDSGDPFSNSKQTKTAFWFKWVEKWTYKFYDYLTIPTENAIPLYAPMIDKEKIRIIPQGFRMDSLKLYEGSFDGPIRMAYAGVFYFDIRNPEFLFAYLNTLSIDYEFYLFMRDCNALVDDLLAKYPSVKPHVRISTMPHDELITELSRMHFLINIENLSNTQMPSKLIDYGMTGRPIFSCNKTNFSPEKFNRFVNGDYSEAYNVDVKKYDIRVIAQQFENLITQKHKDYDI